MKRLRLFGIALVAMAGLATASTAQEERFDYQVRDAMFRAFGGNAIALQYAMSIIDEKLAKEPDHAEALVWRGAGRYWQAGQVFQAGDRVKAQALVSTGMADMDRALVLQPRTPSGLLLPRLGPCIAWHAAPRHALALRFRKSLLFHGGISFPRGRPG